MHLLCSHACVVHDQLGVQHTASNRASLFAELHWSVSAICHCFVPPVKEASPGAVGVTRVNDGHSTKLNAGSLKQ
jgi:hypothetical protein